MVANLSPAEPWYHPPHAACVPGHLRYCTDKTVIDPLVIDGTSRPVSALLRNSERDERLDLVVRRRGTMGKRARLLADTGIRTRLGEVRASETRW